MVLAAYLGRGRFAVPKDAVQLNVAAVQLNVAAVQLDVAALERVEAGELTPLTISGRMWNFEEAARDQSESYFRGEAASETVPVGNGGNLPAPAPVSVTQHASFDLTCAECGGLPSSR